MAKLESSLSKIIESTWNTMGSTAPNPPVGAAIFDQNGVLLASATHPGAGYEHAEVLAFNKCAEEGVLNLAHTLFVTLEPCNHFGRTPPCTQAILETPIKRVLIGAKDLNPNVAGGGAAKLERSGIDVQFLEGILKHECERLVRPFFYWAKTRRPWVLLKAAWTKEGSMIPPAGQKTFTSPEALRFAHKLRRRSDAILTGSGTILADHPEFTVRHIPDHGNKKRTLVILDRRNRIAASDVANYRNHGFHASLEKSFDDAVERLGQEGVHQVLVEAGPTLYAYLIQEEKWNEQVSIYQATDPELTETIEFKINEASPTERPQENAYVHRHH